MDYPGTMRVTLIALVVAGFIAACSSSSNSSSSEEDTETGSLWSTETGAVDTDTAEPEPGPGQTGLLFIEVDCDDSVMEESSRRCDNVPVPCIPDEPKVT